MGISLNPEPPEAGRGLPYSLLCGSMLGGAEKWQQGTQMVSEQATLGPSSSW